MAISLKSMKKKTAAELQPIFTIYGVPKIGKSSLGSEFPRPVFVQTAEGESVPAGVVADTLEVRNYGELCEGKHPAGIEMRIEASCIDSGGHFADHPDRAGLHASASHRRDRPYAQRVRGMAASEPTQSSREGLATYAAEIEQEADALEAEERTSTASHDD